MRCKGAANALVSKIDARGRVPAEIVGELRRPGGFLSQAVRDSARWIVEDVRDRGDAALLEYTERFDGVRPQEIRVPRSEIDRACGSLSPELEESFNVAIENVRAFHQKEMDRSWERSHVGATTGQRVRPIRRAGLYIPGGHAAYPSTLFMSAVPAQVAGVRGIGICTPPGPDGLPDSNVLALACLLGLEEVYAVGGAQAIAALAYGTESVATVDKVVGPGNDYVTAAKLEVFRGVGRAAHPERTFDLRSRAAPLRRAGRIRLPGACRRPGAGGRDLQPLRSRTRARDLGRPRGHRAGPRRRRHGRRGRLQPCRARRLRGRSFPRLALQRDRCLGLRPRYPRLPRQDELHSLHQGRPARPRTTRGTPGPPRRLREPRRERNDSDGVESVR